jgi:transcriptional regulator with XRE-family HTH domain
MKPKFKLGKAEIQKRVLELETLFGQAKLSKKLGVSKDSIRRYRDGKTLPQTKNIYKKLNAAYNKNKKFIDTGLVEKKRQQITKRKTVQAKGKTKERTTIIYPDYMYNSPAKDFSEARYFEKLEDLHNSGYVASWVGGKETPLEVQFIIDGEDLTRFGKVVNIVIGNVNELIGEVIFAEEDAGANDPDWYKEDYHDSHTWTKYVLKTENASLEFWYLGESNGYYCESVSIKKI